MILHVNFLPQTQATGVSELISTLFWRRDGQRDEGKEGDIGGTS